MFERTVFGRLREWAGRENRKPLILRGARQVGKTTVVNEFAKEFDDYLSLNLERKEEAPHDIAIRVWSGAYSVDEVTTVSGKKFRLINLPFYYVGAIPAILKQL